MFPFPSSSFAALRLRLGKVQLSYAITVINNLICRLWTHPIVKSVLWPATNLAVAVQHPRHQPLL